MSGFHVAQFGNRQLKGITALHKLIDECKIKYQETTVTEGFEKLPQAWYVERKK